MLNPRYTPVFTTYGHIYDTPWPAVKKEREELEKTYLEAKHHGRLVADLLESIEGNPESPTQISTALLLVLFIFFIGVIYPLSFMPAIGAPEISASITTIKNNIFSFKGALLGVISAAFTIIVTIFYKTNTGMKYDPTDLIKLGGLTDAKNYCQYFKFIDESDLITS
jgi:cbb3-type cytochrome oxidase subunit 3